MDKCVSAIEKNCILMQQPINYINFHFVNNIDVIDVI